MTSKWIPTLICAVALIAGSSLAHADETCKMTVPGYGVVIGQGPNNETALLDAAGKCVSKKRSRIKDAFLDENTKLDLIDDCVNIACET